MEKMYRYLYLISFITFLFLSCEKLREKTLAEVNDSNISLEFYLPRYNNFLFKTHQVDNLLNRHIFLNSLIDEKLIVDYAYKNKITNDPTVIREKQRMYDQLLLNQFFEHEIIPLTHSTDAELRRLFIWSKTSLHVRHLFARDLEFIKAIQKELHNGADWNALAKSCFEDHVLKENGGDLGWINIGDMDPAFEVVAYSLVDAKISDPVKTEYGFSIIQVIEHEKDIFLTEQGFQLEKDWLKLMAAHYKKLPAIRAYTDSVESRLGIQFDQSELSDLFLAIIHNNESNNMYSRSDLVFFQNKNTWSVREIYSKLNDLSPRQFNQIKTKENLISIIKGLAVREKFLQKAEKLNLHQTSIFPETFNQKTNDYLINICLDNLYKSVPFDNERAMNIKTTYLNFRNELAINSTIKIDSLAVKSFILNQPISS